MLSFVWVNDKMLLVLSVSLNTNKVTKEIWKEQNGISPDILL